MKLTAIILLTAFWTFRGMTYSVRWDSTGRAHIKLVEGVC